MRVSNDEIKKAVIVFSFTRFARDKEEEFIYCVPQLSPHPALSQRERVNTSQLDVTASSRNSPNN